MSHYKWNEGKGIAPDECEKIIKEYSSNNYDVATTSADSIKKDIRKTDIQWIPETRLISRALESYVMEANAQWFKFELGMFEIIQFARYQVGDSYGFHKDHSNDNKRKLSVTVQLSDKKDYDGGEFQFYSGDQDPEIPDILDQGSVIVFDSRDWHRVTPITRGTRYSLVMWVKGPPFK